MQRRDFLKAAAGAFAAAQAFGDEKPPIEIVDCHTHFYDPSRPEGTPWPGKNDKTLYRTVLPDEYKKFAAPLGVTGTVVVEASPWLEDNQWLLDLAAKEPFILGVVGNLDLTADDFEKHVVRFSKNPLYRGFRISRNKLVEALQGDAAERVRLLIERDLELDVNGGPETPADVAKLGEKAPKLRIVVNHCANLRIDGKEPPREWREGMAAAARHPNVFCKVSALVESTIDKPAPSDLDYYRPVLDVLWNLFGEDRLVFGSNWPVSDRAASFTTVLAIVREYFAAKGPRAAEKYFSLNARSAYAWPKR